MRTPSEEQVYVVALLATLLGVALALTYMLRHEWRLAPETSQLPDWHPQVPEKESPNAY